MTYQALQAARYSLDSKGTAYSELYDDVYHSADGALEQAHHVFLGGNDLPQRWQQQNFVILEIGFGVGINFLASCQAWQEQPGRHLHYVAIEKHPFAAAALQQHLDRYPQLAAIATQLLQQWPPLLPGLHRLDFGGISLSLCFGDAEALLPQLQLRADSIYLDGFAPQHNPALWSNTLCSELARLAAPAANLASWCVAGEVRRRLERHGFSVEKRPGFGNKREMLSACFHAASKTAITTSGTRRRIAVIGAGIAGAACAQALRQRGHTVIVLEAAAKAASGASGNHMGVFRPLPSLDDSRLSRLLRAGFLLGRRRFSALRGVRHDWCGVLHIARDAEHEARQAEIVTTHELPPDYCRFLSQQQATEYCGTSLELGGWWFPGGGWINPPSLCQALLADCYCRYDYAVTTLERRDGQWQLNGRSAGGLQRETIHADDVVLANAVAVSELLPEYALPIRAGRGQVSHLPAQLTPPLEIVVTRQGYVTPALDGLRCAGATMQLDDKDSSSRLADHLENLQRLELALPGFASKLDAGQLLGRVGWRPMSPDRLPLVGPLSASDGLWLINGFGARGLVFAAICAELLASQLSQEPLPLESDLVAAVSPLRFKRTTLG